MGAGIARVLRFLKMLSRFTAGTELQQQQQASNGDGAWELVGNEICCLASIGRTRDGM